MSSGKGKNRDVNAALRAHQALSLRKLGATYQAVAEQCGYGSRAAAYHAVQRELSRTLQEPADDVRKLELERLDDLWRAMAVKAYKGDTWSVDRCLKIMERRAALLGLDTQPGTTPTAQMVVVGVPQAVMEAI